MLSKKYKNDLEHYLKWMTTFYNDEELSPNDKIDLIGVFMLKLRYQLAGMSKQNPDDVCLFLGTKEMPTGISKTFIDKISIEYWGKKPMKDAEEETLEQAWEELIKAAKQFSEKYKVSVVIEMQEDEHTKTKYISL